MTFLSQTLPDRPWIGETIDRAKPRVRVIAGRVERWLARGRALAMIENLGPELRADFALPPPEATLPAMRKHAQLGLAREVMSWGRFAK